MRNLSFLAVLMVFITSCITVQFTQPQPEGKPALTSFPEEFRGTYLMTEPGDCSNTDSLVIFAEGFLSISQTGDSVSPPTFERQKSFLSDSLVLKFYKGEYYLNVLDKEEKTYSVLLLKKERNGDCVVWMINAEKEIETLRRFTSDIEEVVNTEGKTDYYIANPSAKELSRFVESGGFQGLLYRLQRAD
ncbi:MAG: hypothetical protein SF052_06495 [Bacteroidia bacterium]|nr:hypothetical protein [Bacteroidia bacterium]